MIDILGWTLVYCLLALGILCCVVLFFYILNFMLVEVKAWRWRRLVKKLGQR